MNAILEDSLFGVELSVDLFSGPCSHYLKAAQRDMGEEYLILSISKL